MAFFVTFFLVSKSPLETGCQVATAGPGRDRVSKRGELDYLQIRREI